MYFACVCGKDRDFRFLRVAKDLNDESVNFSHSNIRCSNVSDKQEKSIFKGSFGNLPLSLIISVLSFGNGELGNLVKRLKYYKIKFSH